MVDFSLQYAGNDVTPGWIQGLAGGASAGAGAYDVQRQQKRDQLDREVFELSKRTAEERTQLERDRVRQQQELLDIGSSEREGRGKALDAYAKIAGAGFQMPAQDDSNRSTNESFWGRSDESAPVSEDEEAKKLGEYLSEQRRNVLGFAQNFTDPNVRRAYLESSLPLLGQDEKTERETVAQRWQLTHWKEALASGLLDPEEQATAQEAIDALSNGAVSSTNSKQSLAVLRNAVATRTRRAMDTQFGMSWGQQQIAEATAGGVDASTLHKVLTDWMTGEKRDPKDLQRKMLDARYGLKPRTIKLGRAEVPQNVDVLSPQWKMIAESEADHAASELLSKDPVLAAKLKKGDDIDPAEYQEMKADAKKQIMRGWAAQFGAGPAEIEQLGLVDDREKRAAMKQAEKEIRAALKAAGIDPDKELPRTIQVESQRPAQPTQRNVQRSAYDFDRSKLPPDGRDVNNDGTIDEEDIEKSGLPK